MTVSKAVAGLGRLNKICKDAFRMARAVQGTPPSDMLGGHGADFLRGLAFPKWKRFEFAMIISHDRCGMVRYFIRLGFTFSRRAQDFLMRKQQKAENLLARGCQLCMQLFTFEGKSRRISSLRSCEHPLLRKSRRIVLFWTCQLPLLKEAAQNCFFSGSQTDRWIDG